MKAQKKTLSDPNFEHLAGLNDELTKSLKKTLASPVLMMNLDHKEQRVMKKRSKKAMLYLI